MTVIAVDRAEAEEALREIRRWLDSGMEREVAELIPFALLTLRFRDAGYLMRMLGTVLWSRWRLVRLEAKLQRVLAED